MFSTMAIRAVVISVSIWLLFSLGLNAVLDTPFSDIVHRLTASDSSHDSAVLAVAFPVEKGIPEDAARELAEDALGLGASGIVFLGGSFANCERFVGTPLGDSLLWESLDANRIGCGIVQKRGASPQLALAVPPRDHGVVHRLGSAPPNLPIPTISELVSQLEGLPPLPRAVAPRFVGGSGSLPIISAEHMLASGDAVGGVIAGLTAGRWVLIGQGSIPGGHGVHTPTTTSTDGMSELELRAQILNSVLNRDLIIHLPAWLQLILCVGAGFGGVFLSRRGRLDSVALRLLVLSAALALVAVAGLVAVSVWIPAVQLAVCAVVAAGDAARSRMITSNHALDALASESRDLLRGVTNAEAQASFDPQGVIVAFDQILKIDRILLLEAEPGEFHVRELAAERCTFDDLSERRRDIRRAPFSLALDAAAPVRIPTESRPFFKLLHEEEHQYLAPLSFGSELFGFAAVATKPMGSDEQLSFVVSLQALAREVGELYYQRRSAHGSLNDSTRGSSFAIARVLRLLRLRLDRHRLLLEGLTNAVVLYDLFGTVLEINDHMTKLLGNQGITPFRSSPFELLKSITALDEGQIRKLIRQVVLEGGRASLPAALRSDPERSLTLSLRPLTRKDRENTSYGLVCEILDTTASEQRDVLRSEFAAHVDSRIRSDLGGIDMAANLLATDDIDAKARSKVVKMLREKVTNAEHWLDTGRRYLQSGISPEALEGYPIDVAQVLSDSLKELQPSLDRDTIKIELIRPEEAKFVLAAPEKLDRLIRAAVGLLQADAVFGSTLQLELREEEGGVVIRLQSEGYGLPEDTLKASLEGGATMSSLRELQRGRYWLEDWGGELALRSKPGEGTGIDIQLRSVN